jgi:hypothetical protein
MINTLHDQSTKKYIAGVLIVMELLAVTILMASLLGACASLPRDPGYDGASEQIQAPSCADNCWVMAAKNDNFNEARVYINGRRAATIPGLTAKAVNIPITRSMLNPAGCVVVFVRLYPDTRTASSSDACPVPGSQLELAIDDSNGGHPLRLWLQDWRKR